MFVMSTNWGSVPIHQTRLIVIRRGITENTRPALSHRGTVSDQILQWPVFEQLLSSLQRFPYIDFHGTEAYSYLDDLTESEDLDPHSPSGPPWKSSAPINISTEKVDVEKLVEQFHQRVNIKNPILSRRLASEYCQKFHENGLLFNLDTCLVLLMCALGAISMDYGSINTSQSPGNNPSSAPDLANLRLGHSYFTAAEKRLGAAISTLNTLSIQCLCLAGIFHMYSIQPMHALRMFHAAGISLQNLSSTGARPAGAASQMYSSLFWLCYKSEREILAEIPINAPALREPGMPNVYPQPPQAASIASNEWAADEEDSWYFLLSEIALRRITDQVTEIVSKYIHADIILPGSQRIQQLIPIVAEFEQQAETFRENLPSAVKFPDVPEAASTEWQQYSRGRYYRLLELMHRPFLFNAIHDPGCSPVVRSLAEIGLQNALRYIQHSHICHRHHGTWLQLRNELKEASLLLAASKTTWLTMPRGWEAGIVKAQATFDHWSWEFPSCRTYANVLQKLAESSMTGHGVDSPMPYG
ncbi:C6 zinc finger domain-containing protein [Verticillium alfalfae VaMs.102]|uniref:C6 zinc finger domain-containing protein n=1 Tax=Verticillium alfalfae (strain VaMs.102 / ATCC MYA-4576 / FGSC 10136) TaxID=526221 RepID=C9SS78_VERA1|nr:C6 zinc finger domain-containing protein [Verticillium alfalfae VaMs.102]EEY21643.1 C6 zinc finger domain-containing protein [Verticillium alfalfae VaMs.102]